MAARDGALLSSERDATAGPEPMLTIEGVAAFLSIGERTAWRWVRAGVLPRPDLRRGRVVRWFPETIRRWVARQRRRGGGDA